MPNIWQELRSKLQYRIILPFLGLTLFVAMAGYFITFYVVANAQEERFRNQLAETARSANQAIVNQERANLQFLIEVVFSPGDPTDENIPALNEALHNNNPGQLENVMRIYFNQALVKDTTLTIDRLIAFNNERLTVMDMERDYSGTSPDGYVVNPIMDLSDSDIVNKIINREADDEGDKYAEIVQMGNKFDTSKGQFYFFTYAPVVSIQTVVTNNLTETEKIIVGGMMVGMRLETLGQKVLEDSEADTITFYDLTGNTLDTLFDPNKPLGFEEDENPDKLNLEDEEFKSIITQDKSDGTIFFDRSVGDDDYLFSFTRLQIRTSRVGFMSAGFLHSRKDGWEQVRLFLIVLTLVLMFGIIGIGVVIAGQITISLGELVSTARDVTAGNLDRRSTVKSHDEIGELSDAFNLMTGHLLDLYSKVLAEYGRREAIFESIGDGVIVCDNEGEVQLANRATYTLLGLDESSPLPGRFSDLPLIPMTESVFGASSTKEVYSLGSYYVGVSESPVVAQTGGVIGKLYVLQDLTTEVQMDRARTGFIRTISHEMRTPLTSLRGNVDMLMHGLAGPLQGEQFTMVETMSQQTSNMTRLLNNMIAMAGLDSGSTRVEPESLELKRVIEESLWPLRKTVKAKNLFLDVEIPDSLQVEADRIQLRTIVQQLVENARVYTEEGGITIRALRLQDLPYVRIDVTDTGCGIEPELIDKVFERFVRGEESNDRPDRGIGLGLAIVKHLVEMHGGRVSVSSEPGHGSTFSFTLRCAHDTGSPEHQPVTEAA
jgi:signal transduction histidine kinase